MSEKKNQLEEKIRSAEVKVGVIGMGYVGLPLAIAFAEKDIHVLGFDSDINKVDKLNSGANYIDHLDSDRLRSAVNSGYLKASHDFSRLDEPDAIIICVPTPLTHQRDPDISYIVGTSEKIRDRLRSGQLVILESTTYPATTDELVKNILEETGLVCGRDFFLAFSPEREDPGNVAHSTITIPKVVGGVDIDSGDLAQLLYDQAVKQTVRVSSARAAEAAKLTENIFRAVNIALVNELKIIYERMGVDIWEVLDAASTKPFGFMRFDPGPGWGGHCIPLDPFYLSWKARQYGVDAKFIELAGEINRRMPEYVVDRLQQGLNSRGKAMKGSNILVLGLSYKKGVADTRESPAYQIIPQLVKMGALVDYHDPFVPTVPPTRSWPGHPDLESQALTPELIASRDAIVLITDHPMVDYEMIAKHADLIVDSRGVYREPRSNVIKA
jgi:UDP-N-acetyl-D-glucosamine dehydrogenase